MSESYSDYTSEDGYGSDDGLILTIDLNPTASDQIIHAAKRTTTSNFQGRLKSQQQNLAIIASTLLSGVEGDVSLRVIKTSKPQSSDEGDSKTRDRWVHFQTDGIAFEDFERLVINFTLQHHDNLIPVVIYLLRKIQDNYEKSSAYGSYIEPGTVLRSDGTDRSHQDQPDLSAIFISFPYLDIGKWRPPNPPKDESLHLPRGLFQSSYTQETALNRDGEQMFRKFKGVKADQFLRVPQLWVLVLQSKTIVTCGPSALPEMFAEHIEFVDEETLLVNGPSLVQVTDFLRRVTYLPIDQCRTFLGLKQSIEQQCLSDTEYGISDCILHSSSSEGELIGSQWPDLLKDETSVFVYIRISRRASKKSEPTKEGPLPVEAPNETRMIEYAGLSSDESGDEGDRMALTIIQERTGEYTTVRKSDFSKAAEETRKRLDDEGYVVNKPRSLGRNIDSVPSVEKPKVFKRPTQVEASTWDSGTAPVLHGTATQQTESLSEIQESHATDSTSLVDVSDDLASIAPASFEDITPPEPGQTEEVIYKKLSHSNGPESANSGSEDWNASRRSSGYEDKRSNLSTESFEHDQAQQHESNTPGALDYKRRAKKAHTDDMGTEESGHSSAGSSSEIYSPRSPSSLPDNGQRVTRAKSLQPTVESEDEESDPKPPTYRPDVDESTYFYPENSEAGTKRHTEETGAPKGSADINASAVGLVEDKEANENKPVDLAGLLKDVKQTIKEEVGKQNKQESHDEFEKKMEDEMRKPLARFGFQENQIQAMTHPEKPATIQQGMTPANPLPAHQPTYVKAHKDHLSIDTLVYYDIPYEIDPQDSNYIIILREMETKESEILFEHTRRLRQRDTRLLTEKRASNKPDYAWVRRSKEREKSKPRYESFRYVEHEDLKQEPRQRGAKPRETRGRKKKTIETDVRDASPPPVIKELLINLQVPPFLAWPTTLEEDGENTSKEGPDTPNEQDGALTQLTLSAITKHMQKLKRDEAQLPVSSHHPFLNSYKSGKAFVDVPEKAANDLELDKIPKAVSSADYKGSQTLLDIQDELGFIKGIREGTNSDLNSKPSAAQRISSIVKGKTKLAASIPSRRVTQWQMSRLCTDRDSLFSSAQQLIDQFVSKHYPHPLLRKCWGTFDAINKAIADMCTENETLRMQEANNNFSLIYVVKNVPDENYRQMHQLEDFAIPIGRCAICSRSSLYPDIDDAYQHLHQFHSQKAEIAIPGDQKNKLGHWLVSTASVELERRNAEMINLIQVINRRTEKLLHKAVEIRNSVANDKNEKPSEYLLPSALVKAAEKIFQFMYTARYTVQYLRDQHEKLTASTGSSSIEVQDNIALAEYFGIAADNDLSKAQNELLLMAHTGSSDGTSIVRYISSTPETTVSFSLYCLITRNLHQDMGIQELYRNHLSSLRYNAGHRPSKRTLRELYLLEDEIEIVASVLLQQDDAMKRLAKVFDSSSYRITDRVRINAFKRLEQPAFELWSAQYREMDKETKKLQGQIAKTAQVLRYNIEVAEEGHSKAILVFTLVTIVFLPLSFVASLFGMNTADMRNLQNTQSLFWAVALPLTAVIGGLSLLIAYGGTQIGERFDDLRESIRQGRRKTRREKPSPTPQSRKRDEEEVDDMGLKPPSASSALKRRKTAKNAFVIPTKLAKRSSEKKPSATRRKVPVARRSNSQTREYRNIRVEPGGHRQQDVVEVLPDSSPERKARQRRQRIVGIKEMFY